VYPLTPLQDAALATLARGEAWVRAAAQ